MNNIQFGFKTFQLDACLTLYHRILTFNDPNEEGFGKNCR